MECWETMGGKVGYSESGGKFMRFLTTVMKALDINLSADATRWAIRKHQKETTQAGSATSYERALQRVTDYPFSTVADRFED